MYIFFIITNKDIDQLKKCYKLVPLQNKHIYLSASMDLNNIQSITSQNTNIINQLGFCCIEIPSDYREFFYSIWHSSREQKVIFHIDSK